MTQTLEEPLFDFIEWDQDQTYYRCTLNCKIGNFQPGRKFPIISINPDLSLLTLTDQDGVEYYYHLVLTATTQIRKPE
jgi:hypothetical protein